MFYREIQAKINKYLQSKQVLVITGMRRVGKTTLLKYYYQQNFSNNKVYLNFEDVLTQNIFAEVNYANIRRSLEENGLDFTKKAYIYIDEVQYVKNAPSVIKYLYDEFDVKFIVTGSSSYYLRNRFTESLAGRKIILGVYPLTFEEFLEFKQIKKKSVKEFANKAALKSATRSETYNDLFAEYIEYGGFPEVVLTRDYELKKQLLRDILTSYFQIDVANLSDFEDSGKLLDLLILLTQRVGKKLELTTLATALGVKRAKIYEYLEFLQSTYVIRLIGQKTSIDNKVSASSKLYFTDTGLANILADIDAGSRLENGVFMNLQYEKELTYYQTSSDQEIDFIVDGKVGLEVKNTPAQRYLSYLKKRAEAANLEEYYLVSNLYVDMEKLIMAWDI